MAEEINPALGQIVTQLAAANQNMSQLIQVLQNITRLSYGTITWTAAASVTVSNTSVTASSYIVCFPSNASAGTLVGSAKSPYVSARTAGASFTLTTASGAAAAGGETMVYILFNPS